MDHVAAHLPEADEAELHQSASFTRCGQFPHRLRGVALQPHPHGRQAVVAQRQQVAVAWAFFRCPKA